MTAVPAAVAAAATALRLDAGQLRPFGGATGATWRAGTHVLRLVPRARATVEDAAVAAAGAVLPVPRVIDRVDVADTAAFLLERLPGRPAGDLTGVDAESAHALGRICGRLHATLAGVPAPAAVPAVSAGRGPGRLLHLDLHPMNVLVEDGQVTGVLDWANAAAGDPALDRARSWAILTFDPQIVRWAGDPAWAALREGWLAAAGAAELPHRAREWAVDYLRRDLADRYPPAALEHVRVL